MNILMQRQSRRLLRLALLLGLLGIGGALLLWSRFGTVGISLLTWNQGVPFVVDEYLSSIPDETQRIYQAGLAQGNRPFIVARVGDSITETSSFLTPLAQPGFDLGAYSFYAQSLAWYRQPIAPDRAENTLQRRSTAAGVGWSSYQLLAQASDPACQAGEVVLVCEYRLIQPSFAIIMLGTNDSGFVAPQTYSDNMRAILDITVMRGIVPIVTTIPPRPGYDTTVNAMNDIARQLAADYRVPLIEYHNALLRLPANGLAADGVHPSLPPGGYARAAAFDADGLRYGFPLRNLLTLAMLDRLYRALVTG